MSRPRKEPLSDLEKLAQKIGDDWKEILAELEAFSVEDLNKRIAQANQSISETKSELEANENYVKVCNDKKLLSSGFREVKKRQNAIIEIAVKFRQEKGAP